MKPMLEFPSFSGGITFRCVYDHVLLISSSIGGHLGCSHLWAPVNNAAMKLGVQMSSREPAFISSHSEAELLGQMVILFLSFGGTAMLFSIATVASYVPTSSARWFQFLSFSVQTPVKSGAVPRDREAQEGMITLSTTKIRSLTPRTFWEVAGTVSLD